MWLLVLFDLPTTTLNKKKRAGIFRKKLLNNGFRMLQYSVYQRHFGTMEKAEVYIRQIKQWLPPDGHVALMPIPDKSYAKRQEFYGYAQQKNHGASLQISLF